MAADSDSLTASAAPSPAPLAPARATHPEPQSLKPIAAALSPAPLRQGSVTSREWVIPPRPKPGRKPASDTPPTKRKAQNRAAQRAFRERRAARVGELEEQLGKMEEENEQAEADLKEQIDSLSKQLTECQSDLHWWRTRCETLERDLMEARRTKETAIKDLRPASSGTEAANASAGCERCSPSRCQCIDDAFDLANVTDSQTSSSAKRPNPSSRENSTKRYKSDAVIKPEPEELEVDFTHTFTAPRQSQNQQSNSAPTELLDPCGFCQDGTPCICAEMAADQPSDRPARLDGNKLAPIQNVSQFTPPPSEGDVSSEPLPSISTIKLNPCANGPGTCSQCLADPRSTLFCKSLAATSSSSAACGGCGTTTNASGSGCCQSRSSNRDDNGGKSPVTLSCSDTFTALSRHPHFNRATDELNTWLPRLHTLPGPGNANVSNRPTMEVEAASVMGVLRYFDRRFAN